MSGITGPQLKTLQTLFGLYAKRSLVLENSGDERAARLAWAAQSLGRAVASFTELRANEAARLIDALKDALGQPVSPRRKRLDRDAAMARGAHGRKGRKVRVEMMATPEALEEIARLRERLGWSEEHFVTWLKSRSSPLCGRAKPKLLTIADCNRTRWALQAMARRAAETSSAAVQEVSAVAQ